MRSNPHMDDDGTCRCPECEAREEEPDLGICECGHIADHMRGDMPECWDCERERRKPDVDYILDARRDDRATEGR